jgi:hypothetical protein
MTCTYDNGDANQWSAVTGEPGHDGPAQAPLQPPHYVVAGPNRGDDMCVAMLTVQRAPYGNATYTNACAEAQAIYDGTCTDKALNFGASACGGQNESLAMELVGTLPDIVQQFWCGPKGAAAKAGATCDEALTCALACGATQGMPAGISQACADACKANVNAYGPTRNQSAQAASAEGGWRFDVWRACAQRACADDHDYQSYLDCATVECTNLTKGCSAP